MQEVDICAVAEFESRRDREGIKTPLAPWSGAPRKGLKADLIEKGLRPGERDFLAFVDPFESRPDREGIKTEFSGGSGKPAIV